MDVTPAPIFRKQRPMPTSSALPSSSPSFGRPVHPLRPFGVAVPKAPILPIILPPATLRPLAFRTFTKKHSLTLTSSTLQELASFIGRHCGSGWREEGLAERVLEEVARSWKNRNGGVIVDGASAELHNVLKTLEASMSGGKMVGLPRGDSTMDVGDSDAASTRLGLRPTLLKRVESNVSLGTSDEAEVVDVEDEADDPRAWLKVIDAYEQPRLVFNVGKKNFEREASEPTLFPPASHKTMVFRNRYHVIHQRLLRNEAFQTSTVAPSRKGPLASSLSSQQALKMTPIANMLGRHGSRHMLLGQLVLLPVGGLAISDLSGSIALDVGQAVAIPHDSAWFCPGMVVLVDGVYEEEQESVGKGLSGSNGVGGTLGGCFQAIFIGQPPCEKRRVTLGLSGPDGGPYHTIGGGFGWIDFLGVGSERAIGAKMRRLERRLLRPPASSDAPNRNRVVLVGELQLDQPRALQALRKILSLYDDSGGGAEERAGPGTTPLSFVLTGNFTQHAVLARGGCGGSSIEYKECFDALAAVLAEFPRLLQSATFVFVPGDNDGWVSAFTAGAAAPLPRKPVPDMFTSRVRRAFTAANAEPCGKPGAAVWTSNPSRLSLFGPVHDIVLFRDDLAARLRRTCVTLKRAADAPPASPDCMDVDPDPDPDVRTAQKLVKTLLDQGYLAPFRPVIRPVHWDYASALHLCPLPSAMALVDASAPPFCITYEGCHVMNPASLLVPGRKAVARWVEYKMGHLGRLRESTF